MHRFDDSPEGESGGGEHIIINHLSKIEGHCNLDIKIKDGKVEYTKLAIAESKRFYTQAIRGKAAISLPMMTSRICGTCSIAHLTCCSQAVENAVGYRPSDQTLMLRELSMHGMMIRDHALHLYLFCLPDLFGKDSILDFDKSQDEMVRKAFAIKAAGNNMSKVISGRAVHSTFATVGKFSHVPDKAEVGKVIQELKSIRNYVIEFIDIFYACDFKLERDTNFLALIGDDYSYLGGKVCDSRGICTPEENYWDYLNKEIIPYSQAVGYKFKGQELMVGALARMNLNRDSMHSQTKADASKSLSVFPSKNIFHNNLAQAIEILHSVDISIELLESNEFKEEHADPVVMKEGRGVGAIEAPRGTLYYTLSVGKDGKVQSGNIIVPTQQNQVIMERSVAQIVEANIAQPKDKIEFEIEKTIRAYDPCMSCASHFLKVKWRQSK